MNTIFLKYVTVLIVITFFNSGYANDVLTAREFYRDNKMYSLNIKNWQNKYLPLRTQDNWVEDDQTVLEIYSVDPNSQAYCPDQDTSAKLIYSGRNFKLKTSGNKTKGTAKASVKIKFAKKERFLGLDSLNVKSMWNDPSMLREALVWDLFEKADIAAPRLTYTKFCVNNVYQGLFALIEQVDEVFLQDRLGKKLSKGNLYKASWGQNDLGPATLAMIGDKNDPNPQGHYYFKNQDMDERTYQLKTNEDDIALNTYDDLAQFIRIIDSKNPIEIEKVFEVKSFLRWAAVNQLVGAWDNYLRTGANYYIYNSSTDPKNPKFIWIPWDYDNTFGISYNESDINTAWQVWPIDKWILGPSPKYQRPVIEILLNNPEYRNYYINFAKNFMNKHMSGNQFESRLTQLFNHISSAAYKESDCAECSPFTGRQFSNHIFYQHNVLDQKIQHQNSTVEGIRSFTRARLNYINKNF